MTVIDNKTNTQAVPVKIRKLKKSELNHVYGAKCAVNSSDCCHPGAYKTGDYKITRISYLTIKKYEYFCPMCETEFWMTDLGLFE